MQARGAQLIKRVGYGNQAALTFDFIYGFKRAESRRDMLVEEVAYNFTPRCYDFLGNDYIYELCKRSCFKRSFQAVMIENCHRIEPFFKGQVFNAVRAQIGTTGIMRVDMQINSYAHGVRALCS